MRRVPDRPVRGYGGQDFSSMVDVLCDMAQIERARSDDEAGRYSAPSLG